MTTIAFRDGILAADSQITGGSLSDCTMTKIARNERGEIATGAMAAGASATEAIRIAIRHDIYTGGDVAMLTHGD